jgi:Kef-type K+ transport system membrane component KefB
MVDESIFYYFFLIFTGAAVLATLALYTRQPLLIAYIALGALLGPYGLAFINEPELLSDISQIGIIFLLFLLGLDMQPSSLIHMLKKATLVALLSSFIFAATGFIISLAFGFSQFESMIIGLAMMFSSTIIGIKLLPTTVLHHKHIGELMVGLLLLQDLIAIIVLLVIGDLGKQEGQQPFYLTLLALPAIIAGAYLFVKYILLNLLARFDKLQEYIFLLALGWCLGLAELAHVVGLSREIGAFIAGIMLATSPISLFIAANLKPLRDFFLILFFFTLGASFNLGLLSHVIWAALALATAILIIKPLTFRLLLSRFSETDKLAWDVGFRLGQISEFSLLVAYLATQSFLIGEEASHLIQATAIITFVVSTYIVIFNYPTPLATSDRLRRD